MSKVVIQGEGLGKCYHRGALQHGSLLRDHLGRFLKSPLSFFRRPTEETFWALKDVSLEVHEGEVLGLIGRNGSGKTTLLKILSRITRPTTGWAEIHGRVGSLLEVGTGFHPELTGRENTYLSGAILGMSKQEITRKFDEIVSFAELEKFIDTAVKYYSSGMYVRLAFAVAAHLEPEILLVDEVLAVGDMQFQKKCLGKMKQVGSQGRTIVFVSHNVNAVSSLCRSAMVLANGEVVHFSDNVQEALRLYLSPLLSSHTVDLCSHPGRTSRGAVFEEISVSAENSGPTQCLLPNSNVTIRLKVRPSGRVSGPRISIGVTDTRGERVFAIGTHIGGEEIPIIEGFATVCVRFIIPPLVPGQYTLDIGFYDRTGAPLDEVYGAAAFEILKDNYLSMVMEPSHYFGKIMVPSEWTLTQNENGNSSQLTSVCGRNRILPGNQS